MTRQRIPLPPSRSVPVRPTPGLAPPRAYVKISPSTPQAFRTRDGERGARLGHRFAAVSIDPDKTVPTHSLAQPTQRRASRNLPNPASFGVRRKDNATGLPDHLKAGIKLLSGMSLDDVKVHYNSDKPARLLAAAYTQGSRIHVGPGHERHLAHEAWHVVQQKQGRVKATLHSEGVPINDDEGLEREADVMSAKVLRTRGGVEGCAVGAGDRPLTKDAARLGHRFSKISVKAHTERVGVSEAGVPAGGQTVQRLIDAEGFEQKFKQQHDWFGWRSPYTDVGFARIQRAIQSFHRVPKLVQEEGPEAVNHWRLSQLDAAEHEIYDWHHQNRAQPNHPKMAAIKELMVDLQRSHEEEIDKAVKSGFKLWTPDRDTMDEKARTRLDDLWSAVSTGRHLDGSRSKLQVYDTSTAGTRGEAPETSPDFKKQINAMHARLMTGPKGRRLLEALVYQGSHKSDDGRSIRIRPAHSTNLSDYASVSPGDKDLGSPLKEGLRGKAAEPRYSKRLRQWLPGKGIGSRVTVNPGLSDVDLSHADESAHDIPQHPDTKILSPAFIVYGHELGHALNNLLGRRQTKIDQHLYNDKEISEGRIKRRMALGLGNYVPEKEQMRMRWDDKEEHDVITNIENALRDEHGLTRRKYHR